MHSLLQEQNIEREISIVGTWKLLLDLSTGNTIDRSCTSAYYTFHADGTVEIESRIKEIPSGTFAYEYFCQVSPSWLVTFFVSYWDVDGEIQTTSSGDFEKVFHRIN
jgi:hypothetical protein